MNIGLLAFGFAFVFGAVALIGSTETNEKKPEKTVNYNNIYRALNPEEF